MPNPGLTDEQCLDAVRAFAEHGVKQAAAESLGIPTSTFQNRLRRAADRGLDGSLPRPLPPGQLVRGVSTLYNSENEEVMTWVKTRADDLQQQFFEAAQEFFEHYRGFSKIPPQPAACDEDLLTVYPIADHHLGLHSWGKETGADYNLDIASKLLTDSMGNLVASASPSHVGVVLNLGDFFHADDSKNMTPASGNILDVDTRYMKVLKVGVDLLITTVELALQKHERVIVRSIPGNHDPHAAICLTIALDCFFSNNDRVEVDTSPGEFWWYRFGKVFLGAHHGHRAKFPQLSGAMAALHPKDWGASEHRHFFTGHIHHRQALEINGVEVESFQTLAARDAWAAGNAFTSKRGMKSITFHRDKGEIARNSVRVG